MTEKYVRYDHFGDDYEPVWVQVDNKGGHRKACLCWDCKHLTPDNRETNCPIANQLYKICVDEGMVIIAWECPKFEIKT